MIMAIISGCQAAGPSRARAGSVRAGDDARGAPDWPSGRAAERRAPAKLFAPAQSGRLTWIERQRRAT